MAWWDDGLHGIDGDMPTSGSVTFPYGTQGNLNNYYPVGSLSLDTGTSMGNRYTRLLRTFSLGTQIYIEGEPQSSQTQVFTPIGPAMYDSVTHRIRLMIKKGNTIIYPGGDQWASGMPYTYLLDTAGVMNIPTFSIYHANYYATAENLRPPGPGAAWPRGGSGAGTTIQLGMVSDSTGISFYCLGYTSYYTVNGERLYYECPCVFVGKITADYLNNPELFDPGEDAYVPDDDSSGGGEGGSIPPLPVAPTYPGDDLGFPDLPTGADAFGFSRLKLYKPTNAELADGLDILYSDVTESTLELIIESIKKWVYKPDQYCISLMISAIDATTTTSETIKFGKYDSHVLAPVVTRQWHIVDCGTISVPLKFGSFLDFEPHAKVKLYLPYIGFRTLNANEVIGGTIAIKYYCDILSGSAVCMVQISRSGSNNSVLYTFDCNLNVQVPLTAETYSTVISNLISAGVAGIGMGATIATSGAAAPLIVSGSASIGASLAGAGQGIMAPDMTQSGNLSSNSGVLCRRKPYVCIQMPVPTDPMNYNNLKGRPSNLYLSIGQCSGYTSINDLHVDIDNATDEEKNLIRQAFQRGVFV